MKIQNPIVITLIATLGVSALIIGYEKLVHPGELSSNASYSATAKDGCRIGGCSGQICEDKSSPASATTCEYRKAYGCYKQYSSCEKQENGHCGWTETKGLTKCLKESK